jgi:predicted amidohydrolase
MNVIRGAFVQTSPKFGQNRENVEAATRLASKAGADIYVFPELCNTGYAFRSKKECHSLSESLKGGESVEKFQSFSEKKKCAVVAGLAEKDSGRTYNSSIIIERGKILGSYRKMHLFYREKLWFSRSNSGFKTFSLETLGCKIGVLICFDWIFPEASRKLALEGAEVICHPSDLVLPGKAQVGMMARAFENRVFVITANRVGFENRGPRDKFRFTGKSQIVSPDMEKLATANRTQVVAKVAQLDLQLARNKYVTAMNDLPKDRRKSYY